MKPRCDECRWGIKNTGTNCTNSRKKAGVFTERCLEPYAPTFFEPVEKEFEYEYFAVWNEKDSMKYVGKTMEFAYGDDIRNSKWIKDIFCGIVTRERPFISIRKGGYPYMRTCPETFKKKVKKTHEVWFNLFKDGFDFTNPYVGYNSAYTSIQATRMDYIRSIKFLSEEYEIEE